MAAGPARKIYKIQVTKLEDLASARGRRAIPPFSKIMEVEDQDSALALSNSRLIFQVEENPSYKSCSSCGSCLFLPFPNTILQLSNLIYPTTLLMLIYPCRISFNIHLVDSHSLHLSILDPLVEYRHSSQQI